MSKIIKASQIRQEEKLRQLFAEKVEKPLASEQIDLEVAEQEIEAAHQEVAVLLAKAREEASEILQSAEDEKEQYKEAGYHDGFRQGFEEGYQAGYEQIKNDLDNLFHNFKREVDKVQMLLDHQVQGLELKIIKLSSDIAAKIIRRQVRLKPEIVLDQIENILHQMSRVKSLAIRVNPGDISMAQETEEHFLQLTQGIDHIEFVADHSLEPGGCIIETNSGGMDASIQTQLDLITAILMEGIGNNDEDA